MSDFLKFGLIRCGFEPLLERRRARKRADLMRRAEIVFIHVPRAAGTSISVQLYDRFLGHFPVAAVDAIDDAALRSLPRFAVTREPWERLASAYRFAVAGGGKGQVAVQVAPHVILAVKKAGTFERFVKEWLPSRKPSSLDGLFRPQTYYLIDAAGGLPFEHLGRMEDLRQTEQWLEHKLGHAVRLPHINVAPQDVPATRFDGEMIDIVARLYAADIARLGY